MSDDVRALILVSVMLAALWIGVFLAARTELQTIP